MQYKVEITTKAVKFLKTIPEADRNRIENTIQELSKNPRGSKVIKLNGDKEQYRARQGDYRIIFTIYDAKLVIEIISIDHRKDAYKK